MKSIRKQSGQRSDLQSVAPGFESRPGHYLDLIHGSPEFQILDHACNIANWFSYGQLGFLTTLFSI